MRRTLPILTLVLLVGALAAAQDVAESENPLINQGEMASLLLKVGQPQSQAQTPDIALQTCKDIGLVPYEWTGDEILTHGDLSDVVARYGVVYAPADADDPVSRAFAEAFLRREIGKLRDFIKLRLGHEASASHIMDLGIDRAVSPSEYP